MAKKLVWKEKGKRTLLTTKIFRVSEQKSVSPRGDESAYVVIDTSDWAVVLPVVKNNFLMVKQWRHANAALSVEFPGGVIDKGETPREGAVRELREETGCRAGKITYIGSLSPNPAIMTNRVHFFVAEKLEKASVQDLDDDEFVEVLEVSQKDVKANFGKKTYSHAIHAAAMTLFENYKKKAKK